MSDTVWISTAMGHASNLRPYKTLVEDSRWSDVGQSNLYGEPLAADRFPDAIRAELGAEEKDYRLPDICRLGYFWVVSAAAATVLRQFDLGQGALYSVKVLKKDRETPIGDGWYCINFGNQKNAFLPGETVRARESYIRDGGIKGWTPRLPYKDNDFTVSSAALSRPDIWIDANVGDAFFLSDAIAKALKKAKVDNGFFLGKCRVISN